MKVMFVVYHDIHTEARTQEILQCAQKLGKTYFVSFSKPSNQENCVPLLTGKGIRNYRTFILDCIKYIKKIKPDIIILHDNYTAIILRYLLLLRSKPFIIYDASELYIDVKPKKLKEKVAKVFQYFEKQYLKYADVTIAANIERACIMKEHYKLRDMPLVFDNMHKINDIYNESECVLKYDKYFHEDKFTVLYAGGISKARMTYELADAVGKLGKKFNLIVIGSTTQDENESFHRYVSEREYGNIVYLGFVSRAEFKYFLKKAKVSVSAFLQNTVNNKFCASGKIYESLFEGTPILTTENPPLKRLCEEYGVGVSTNDFLQGLMQLESNYAMYYKNVQKYISQLDYDNRIEHLKEELIKKIKVSRKDMSI